MASDLELLKNRVILESDRVYSVSSMDVPGTFPGVDEAWDIEKFRKTFKVVISELTKENIEFDLIGIDAAIANAFRRILIAEVPSMAIEDVFILNNTSIMHDEVLAHRLGLIPIKADPNDFSFRWETAQKNGNTQGPTDADTIVFKLQVKCTHKKGAPKDDSLDPSELYENSSVYSGQMVWSPQWRQEEFFKNSPPRPVYDDILITKLRPKQEIDLELHCVKVIGKDHAKFSPVATASYRLLPDIIITKPILGKDAEKFQKCFPEGVIEVFTNKDGEKEARVVNPRKDTVSRECLRHNEFKDKVKLTRVRDHFIFNVESVGAIPPQRLLPDAIKVLIEKCKVLKRSLAQLNQNN